jgi:hypothetical protein
MWAGSSSLVRGSRHVGVWVLVPPHATRPVPVCVPHVCTRPTRHGRRSEMPPLRCTICGRDDCPLEQERRRLVPTLLPGR